MHDDVMVYCCNAACRWSGVVSQTVHPKHQPTYWLCPECGEVVEQVEVEGEQVGQVLSEVQKGYSFQGRVIRPARVRVGVAKQNDGVSKGVGD